MNVVKVNDSIAYAMTSVSQMFLMDDDARANFLATISDPEIADDLKANAEAGQMMLNMGCDEDKIPGRQIIFIDDMSLPVGDRILVVFEEVPNEDGSGSRYNAATITELNKRRLEESPASQLGELLKALVEAADEADEECDNPDCPVHGEEVRNRQTTVQ